MQIVEEMLIKAIKENAAERYKAYCSTQSKHCFSFMYRINKRSILRKYHKSEKPSNNLCTLRVRFLIAAIVLSLLVITGFCTYFIVNGFSFRVYPTYSRVSLIENVENPKDSISELYIISESIETELISCDQTDKIAISCYKFGLSTVTLTQSLLSMEWNVNTENKPVEPIEVNGNNGYYIQMEENSFIAWITDGYLFYITGNIDKESALQLAISTKIE